MEIALRVGQFWSEIKLVITNRTPATTRSCDFVITRLITDQIALHSVQLPLFIYYCIGSYLSAEHHIKWYNYYISFYAMQ